MSERVSECVFVCCGYMLIDDLVFRVVASGYTVLIYFCMFIILIVHNMRVDK